MRIIHLEIRAQPCYCLLAGIIFAKWVDIGVIEESAYRETFLLQYFKRIYQARSAADMQQQLFHLSLSGHFLREDLIVYIQHALALEVQKMPGVFDNADFAVWDGSGKKLYVVKIDDGIIFSV